MLSCYSSSERVHLKEYSSMVVMASEFDEDIPAETSMRLALNWKADLWQLHGEPHLSPLLGRNATTLAERVARFMLNKGDK